MDAPSIKIGDSNIKIGSGNPLCDFAFSMMALATAIIGYNIHGSIFWSIMDFFFMPFAWCKWLIMHQVSMSIIRDAFSFFLQ